MEKKCDVSKIKGGEYYSRLSFGKVVSKSNHSLTIQNDKGKDWTIDGGIVENEFYIHGQFTTEEAVTRTEMIEKLREATRIVFVVNYNKQVKSEEVLKTICELYPNKGGVIKSEKDFTAAVKAELGRLVIGEERTLIGYHTGSTDDFGRFRVIDLEQPKDVSDSGYDKRFRLVDPRTLNWLIVNNIKYKIKSR